jgi:Lrp/AsnC family transcriptional regulator for asnA, asnC and gidA
MQLTLRRPVIRKKKYRIRKGVKAMDSMDEEILAILKKDARMPFVSIAKKLRTSEGTIRARVKKMMNEGIIRGFTVKTASKNVKALVEIKINVNINTTNISQRIKKIPGVDSVYEVSGDNDIVALVDVMSTRELNGIIEQIRRQEDTIATKTQLILNEL